MAATILAAIDANGLTFSVRHAGPADGDPVVLLHGFPETSAMWSRLMDDMAEGGLRSMAPDQRGYSPGARPADVAEYGYDWLVADVLALAPEEPFHLVGHDWGAIVGWAVVDAAPHRVKTWTALSVAHYRAFAEAVYSDPEQELYRSMLELFATPAAEEVFLANDMAALKAAWGDAAEDYAPVFAQPGAMTAALNWYRANHNHKDALADPRRFGPVATPTLVLWGRNDPYCRRAHVEAAAAHHTGPYEVIELDAGHFLVQEAYDAVRDNVFAHIGRSTP